MCWCDGQYVPSNARVVCIIERFVSFTVMSNENASERDSVLVIRICISDEVVIRWFGIAGGGGAWRMYVELEGVSSHESL